MNVLALFDFDGTITRKDSFKEFLLYCFGKHNLEKAFLANLHYLLAWKAGIISNGKAKERIHQYFFKGWQSQDFEQKCEQFARNYLVPICKRTALDAIKKHQNQGHRVIIVSASYELYLSELGRQLKAEAIGTQVSIGDDFKLTGKFKGKNCSGPEKVSRLEKYLNLQDYEEIYAYGDSKGDRDMLELADHKYYRHFI